MNLSPTERTILCIYAAIVAAWPIRHLVITAFFRRLDVLDLRSRRYSGVEPPPVTAVIPAKDEEGALPACLESVRAQTYPDLDILVVDDRSTDATPEIARRAAELDPRVRVLTLTELPPGWTGKTHALHVAAAEARGRWLWFLDADTRHQPDCLSIVMEYARANNASLASLLPEMRCESFWEKVVTPLAGIVLMRTYPTFIANDDRRPLAFANGQFLLIERPAYDAVGGHEAVRDRFVEDIGLARLVKATGRSVKTAIAPEISSTRMYTSLSGLVRGWSRILYDAHDRKALPLVGKIVEPLVFSQTGDAALVVSLAMLVLGYSGPFAWWLLGMSLVHQVLKQSVLYRMYRLSSPKTAWYAMYYSLAGIVSDVIIARSIWMCLTGRVTWRGTSYGGSATPPAEVVGRSESAS
ncbi:glycosyltransferase family 2 protein [Tautonia plasticadhaerens]|uniref:4,4'-diaponeurosporenoate glycosyltransferase n=1 Tax=Tautonia plasticadhaerens TaxID=2527974 RepID=A0A518GZB9_9BACT|nr:glycosyltransferase family 2 protein [Tautonia plasticadhaerens]QDV33948.1 4,4'-diaponeurosporenoate glycosyltransferase [Tautonia plasticadhaerens]